MPAPSQGQAIPKYRLLAPAYINEQLYEQAQIDAAGDKGIVIFFDGIPGPHMQPLNAAAERMVEAHPEAMQTTDPLKHLHVIGTPTAEPVPPVPQQPNP